MFSKIAKIVPVLILSAIVGVVTLMAPAGDASARTVYCSKCTGGWCCN